MSSDANDMIDKRDRNVLRNLAQQVAEVATMPEMLERKRLWRALNSCTPERPMIAAFPTSHNWEEMLQDEFIHCRSNLARNWELSLRQTLARVRYIHDDYPITNYFNIKPFVSVTDYGIQERRRYTANNLGSYSWDPPIKSYRDIKKLRMRTIEYDSDRTNKNIELARELFRDILNVRMRGSLFVTVGLTRDLVMLRGLNQVLMDIHDEPNLLHDLMAFLRDDQLQLLDQYEQQGLLTLNNEGDDIVGSGGLGETHELPQKNHDEVVRLCDLWGLSESQELTGVSPQHFQEFALQYQLPIIQRFGLACYGCCEPLEDRFVLLLPNIKNLRRISISPWCNRITAAETLANQYVYSWKPNPSFLCRPIVDWKEIEDDICKTLTIANNCCLEIILKDTTSFHGDPDRITRWTDIASRLVQDR